MEPIGWHITFDLRGRLPIARGPAEWDRLVRLMWRVLAPWSNLGFCIMHDHLHVLVAVDRASAGRVAQAVECAIGWWRRPRDTARRTTWNSPRFSEVCDRRHLSTTAPYVLSNGATATGSSALAWRWSSAWEVLGLRVLSYPLASGYEVCTPAFVADVLVGDPGWRPALAPPQSSPAEPPRTIARIAAAALGYTDRSSMNRRTREDHNRLAIALGTHRGWAPKDLAPVLDIHPRTAARVASGSARGIDAALRLLGLLSNGTTLEELLPEVPPDPQPLASRRRAR